MYMKYYQINTIDNNEQRLKSGIKTLTKSIKCT